MTNDLIYALISIVSHTDDFLSAYNPNVKMYFALLLKLVMTENLRSWKKNNQLLSTNKGSHLFVQGDSFLLQHLWNLPSFHPYPSSFPIAVVGVIVPQNMLWGDPLVTATGQISEAFNVYFWTKTTNQIIHSVDRKHLYQRLLQSREVTGHGT